LDVLIVKLPLLNELQLLHHLALNHGNAVLLRDLTILRLLNQILKEKVAIFIIGKDNEQGFSLLIFTRKTARMILLTFSFWASVRISAKIGITPNLKD
jgi:hypothetical protein